MISKLSGIAFFFIPIFALSQWMQIPTPIINNLADIIFTDNLHGYAVGYEHVLQSSDGGNSWQIVITQPNQSINDLSFPDINIGYVVGDEGVLLKTTDAGNAWISLNSPTYDVLRGVYFLNPDTGFICGQNEDIYRTEDGGITWSAQNTGIYWLRHFSFPTPQVGYCVGDGFTILKTVNGGLNWNWLSGGLSPNLTDVTFLTPDTGYICGYDGLIAKSVDGGLSWQTLNPGVYNNFEGIWFFNTMEGYAMGSDGLIMKTENGGLSWTYEESGTNSILRKAFFFNKDEGFICGHEGTILKKGDCQAHADFDFDIFYFSIYFHNQSFCANKFWWNFGDGYYSDLENPWHMYSLPGIYEVCLIAIDTISMTSDTICKTLEVPSVGIDEKTLSLSIYPNPCSDRFYLNNHKSIPIERIEIYNTLGMKVLTIPVERGKGEIKIDLPDGLYLVKVHTSDHLVLLKRMIVIR
jgi:photosystem II stability/assembly factor-like uncharacterized protein